MSGNVSSRSMMMSRLMTHGGRGREMTPRSTKAGPCRPGAMVAGALMGGMTMRSIQDGALPMLVDGALALAHRQMASSGSAP